MAETGEDLAKAIQDVSSALHVDSLLDTLEALHIECQAANVAKQKNVMKFLSRYNEPVKTLQRYRVQKSDFQTLKILGRGAYAEVALVKHTKNNEVYAMKIMSKSDMLQKADAACIWEERDIMCQVKSDWLLSLHFAFQDRQNLYMVMDYMAGGNMVNLLDNYDFPDEWAKFYLAELVLAVDALHQAGYVHRDIKPENLLLDAKGHLKLADFGTCLKMNSKGEVRGDSAVGTPDYISPEVLESQDGNQPYGKECDWWSVGVLLYEILCGDTPFYDESLLGTYGKIMSHKPEELEFPEGITPAEDSKDLLQKLLVRKEHRLGAGPDGTANIKAHVFFKDIDWNNLRDMPPPVAPDVGSSVTENPNFPEVEEPERRPGLFKEERGFSGNQLPFVGFSFTKCLPELHASGASRRESKRRKSDFRSRPMSMFVRTPSTQYVSKIEEEVEALRRTNLEYQAKVKSLEEKIDHLNGETEREKLLISGRAEKETKLHEVDKINLNTQIANLKALNSQMEADYTKELEDARKSLEKAKAEIMENRRKQSRASEADVNHKEMEDLMKEVSQLKVANRKLETGKELADETLADLRNKLKSVQSEVNEKNDALAAAEEEIDSHRAKLKRAERKMMHDIEDLEHHNETLKKKAHGYKEKVKNIQADLMDVGERYDDLLREKKRGDAKIRTLMSQMEEVNAKLKMTSEDAAPKKNSMDSEKIQSRLSEVEGELAHAQETISSQTEQIQSLQQKLRQSMAVTDEMNAAAELPEVREKLQNEIKTRQELQHKYESAEHDLEALKKKATSDAEAKQAAQDKATALQEALTTAEESVRVAQQKAKELEHEKKDLADSLQARSEELREAHQNAKDLGSQRDNAHMDAAEALENFAALKAKHISVSAQLDELKKQIQNQEIDHKKLQIEVEHQNDELKAEAMSKDALRAQFDAHKEEADHTIRGLKEKLMAATSEVEELTLQATPTSDSDIAQQNEELKAEVETMQQQLQDMEIEVEQQKVRTLEAVNKLQTVLYQKNVIPSDKKEIKKMALEGDIKRLTKEKKGWELKCKKLEMQLANVTAEADATRDQMTEDEEIRFRKLHDKFNLELENGEKKYRLLKLEYTAQTMEVEQLTRTLDEIRSNARIQQVTPQKLQKRMSIFADLIEGWVSVPNQGNLKKNGWVQRYMSLRPEGLFIYKDQEAMHRDEPEGQIDLMNLHHAKPVTQHDVIHAKPSEIARIFSIVVAKVERRVSSSPRAAGSASSDTPRKGKRASLRAPPSIRSGSFGISDKPTTKDSVTIRMAGHDLDKVSVKKATPCNFCLKMITSSILGRKAYECRSCQNAFHSKHVEAKEITVECQGSVDVIQYIFLAPTVDDQRRWLGRVGGMIQRRGSDLLELATIQETLSTPVSRTNSVARTHSRSVSPHPPDFKDIPQSNYSSPTKSVADATEDGTTA